MKRQTTAKETFESFKNSFFYGSRVNMNFKFLEHLSESEADLFFQGLLKRLSEAYDRNDDGRVSAYIIEWQLKAYSHQKGFAYEEGPFAPLSKPLSELRLGLLTSSGHFVKGQDPEPLGVKNMTQDEALARVMDFLKEEPQLSSIPIDTPPEQLCVRHGGYDISGSKLDCNVSLPIQRLNEFVRKGLIAELASPAHSFVGACSQKRLLKKTGPRWVKILQEQKIDAALLVPV